MLVKQKLLDCISQQYLRMSLILILLKAKIVNGEYMEYS